MFTQQQSGATATVQGQQEGQGGSSSALRGMTYAQGAAALSPQVAERKAKAVELVKAMQQKVSGSAGAGKFPAQTKFILDILPDAVVSQLQTEVPASITIAQAALETGYGRSVPPGNNFFGIKGTGSAGTTLQGTQEEVNGQMINTQDYFRKYNDRSESFVDHAKLLSENKRYAKAMDKREAPDQMAVEIKKAGYATDSDYPSKLQWIMKTFGVKGVDPIARQAATAGVTPDECLEAFGRTPGAGGTTQTPTKPQNTPSKPQTTTSGSAQGGNSYIVMPGDTLSTIAQKTLGSSARYPEIARLNGLANPNLIRVGQKLALPGGAAAATTTAAPAATRRYTVQRGDTLSGIAQKMLGDASRYMEIARLNRLTDPSRIQVGQTLALPG